VKKVHVVTGIIFNKKNEVLISLRPPHKPFPDLWEFPGGKVEENESSFSALKRELKEEINIDIISAEPFMQFDHVYPERVIFLDVWKIAEFSGIPHGAENQMIRFESIPNLSSLPFPDGNKFIIEKLKL